jgi:hypothetical protein
VRDLRVPLVISWPPATRLARRLYAPSARVCNIVLGERVFPSCSALHCEALGRGLPPARRQGWWIEHCCRVVA